MRTITIAVATALLVCVAILIEAQPSKQISIPGSSKEDTAYIAELLRIKKGFYKNFSFQNPSATLGQPAGKKLAGHSKREADSLQQIILLRKKF